MLLTVVLLSGDGLRAQQAPFVWDQWRGPHRDGVGNASTLPETLPETLTEIWRVPVGEGYSGPLVIGDTVYQFSRQQGNEVLRALSLADGAEVWAVSYEVAFTPESAAREHGPGPKSTPAYAEGRLFTLGITGVLSAVDATDGEVIWRHDFAGEFAETWPIWGHSMSPIVLGERVIAHVGGDQGGALTAFDAATGNVVWANDEFTPGYASPIVTEVDGTEVLVTLSNENIIAVNADDGTTLWSMRYATSAWQNAVTPLAVDDEVILSGLDMDIFAVSLAAGGAGWQATEPWRSDAQPLYMSSPVRVGDRIFGMTHRRRGQFFALDATTGEPIWTSRGREGENAVFVVLGERIAVLTDAARLVVFAAAADTYEPIAEYEVASSATWAHPAFTPAGVLVKDHDTLALLGF
jgi:outer membrane protein assembly factor BamB